MVMSWIEHSCLKTWKVHEGTGLTQPLSPLENCPASLWRCLWTDSLSCQPPIIDGEDKDGVTFLNHQTQWFSFKPRGNGIWTPSPGQAPQTLWDACVCSSLLLWTPHQQWRPKRSSCKNCFQTSVSFQSKPCQSQQQWPSACKAVATVQGKLSPWNSSSWRHWLLPQRRRW